MKRVIKNDVPVIYEVNLDIDFNITYTDVSLAASRFVRTPTNILKSTFFLTEESENKYDDLITTIIWNICNQNGEQVMELLNEGQSSFYSNDSYTVYPKFRIVGDSRGDRFNLVVRMFDHVRKQHVPSQSTGVNIFKSISVFSRFDVAQVGTKNNRPLYEIIGMNDNIITLLEDIQSISDDFRSEVARRVGRTDQLIIWSEKFASDNEITFDFSDENKSENVKYYFFIDDKKLPKVFDEKDLIKYTDYDSFSSFLRLKLL